MFCPVVAFKLFLHARSLLLLMHTAAVGLICCMQTVCGALRHNTKVNMTGICSIIPLANCCEPAITV